MRVAAAWITGAIVTLAVACEGGPERVEPTGLEEISGTHGLVVGAKRGGKPPNKPTNPSSDGVPVGPFGTDTPDLEPLQDSFGFTGAQAPMGPGRVITYLTEARRLGYKVAIRLAGGHSKYRDGDGNFDLEMWKQRVDRFLSVAEEMQPFIDDGTLLAHLMLDDISAFPGRDPTQDDIDKMARHSKSIWPNWATFVRRHATGMPGRLEDYVHLDGVWNQYSAGRGGAAAWAKEQADAARAAGLIFINGLNILAGGDGSSGLGGFWPNKWTMSADELRTYGEAMLSEGPCALLMWKLEESYFSRQEIRTALNDLAAAAATERATSCQADGKGGGKNRK